ncbi:hypothetical protein V2J09_020876 [Rumex salicifolius]
MQKWVTTWKSVFFLCFSELQIQISSAINLSPLLLRHHNHQLLRHTQSIRPSSDTKSATAMIGPRTWISGIITFTGLKRAVDDKIIVYTLTPVQEQRLKWLQERVNVPFDQTKPDHQEELKSLWYAGFPDIQLKGLISEQWKDMGWQGTNPATDFRGCGFISLQNLLFFARNYPDSFHKILFKEDGIRATWEYPFAVAGINVTFMLIQMLDLSSVKRSTRIGANFLRLLEEDEEAFDVLFCVAFVMLDAQWLAMNASYMEFNDVLRVTKTQLARELCLEDIRRIIDLPAYNLLYRLP